MEEATCAHCGTRPTGVDLKRCARCRQVFYCGAECQKAAWKGHKKTCAPLTQKASALAQKRSAPAHINDVFASMSAAHDAGDWQGVLQWEGRFEELLARQDDAVCDRLFKTFLGAHMAGMSSAGGAIAFHALAIVRLGEERITLLGKMERFRDQGEAMCHVAMHLLLLQRRKDAGSYYQRARKLGAAHGFFSVECQACQGLGQVLQPSRKDRTVGLRLRGIP
ncbi:hypothetical protein T484DRAFT_2591122 [Baffinella frigidus]|nr:hypothetical protein T484DRAFT_2591122 [Cryptophyta sp. CCMP2293]